MATMEELLMATQPQQVAASTFTKKTGDFNPTDQKYNFWTALALSEANKQMQASVDSAAIMAQALGPQQNVFGDLQPGTMTGLSPEQIMSVAQSRTEQDYKRMLTSAGALDFARKAGGQDLKESLTKTQVSGGIQKDITAMQQSGGTERAAITAGGNPVNVVRANAMKKAITYNNWIANGKKGKQPPLPTASDLLIIGGEQGFGVLNSAAAEAEQKSSLKASGMDDETINVLVGLSKNKKADKGLASALSEVFSGGEATPTPGVTGKKATGKTATKGKYKQFTDGTDAWWEDSSGKRIEVK